MTITGLGNAKNAIFMRRIRHDGVETDPGAVRYVQAVVERVEQADELRAHGADRVVTDLGQLSDLVVSA